MTAVPTPSTSSATTEASATMTTLLEHDDGQDDVEAAIQNHRSKAAVNKNKSDPKNQPDEDVSQTTGLSKRIKDRLNISSNHNSSTTTPVLQAQPAAATKAPKDTLKAVYDAGKYKAGLDLNVLIVQCFMAGIYIASAGHLYLVVGGGVLGSALFPGGLIAVVLTNAELFTGDALIFVASVLGKHVTVRSLVRNWTVAWLCNFVGSLCWAYFMSYLSDALEASHAVELAIKVAEKKALNSLGSIFIKGCGANFMVCVAVWQATCAADVAGKVLALWFPTAAFVMMGFDHCVANMFLIPVGMMLGADISVRRLFEALFMATLGNLVGGGIFVGAVYWYVFDSMASFGGLTSRIRQGMGSSVRNFSNLQSARNLNHHHNAAVASRPGHRAGATGGAASASASGLPSHWHQQQQQRQLNHNFNNDVSKPSPDSSDHEDMIELCV